MEPRLRQDRSVLLRKNPGVRREVAREPPLCPAALDPVAFGSGSGQAFALDPFQKREFLWQPGSRDSMGASPTMA